MVGRGAARTHLNNNDHNANADEQVDLCASDAQVSIEYDESRLQEKISSSVFCGRAYRDTAWGTLSGR